MEGMIIGSIMPLVPGVAFVNAIRDMRTVISVGHGAHDRCHSGLRLYRHRGRLYLKRI